MASAKCCSIDGFRQMKRDDFARQFTGKTSQEVLGERSPTRNMSPSAILRLYAEDGAETRTLIEKTMREIASRAPADLQRHAERFGRSLARLGARHPLEHVEKLLEPKPSRSIAVFAEQLALAGSDLHRMLNDPNNQHLAENLFIGAHMPVMWAEWGFPTFSLTHSLTAALLLTEPPPYDEEHFRLPFPTFAIVIPEGFLPFWWGRENNEKHSASLITYHEWDAILSDDAAAQISIYSSEYTLYRRRPKRELCDGSSDKDVALRAFDDDPPLTEHDDVTIAAALRILQNTVAWLTSSGIPEAEGAQRKKKTVASASAPGPTTYVLGRDVKLSPELRRMAVEKALGASSASVPGWKLRMRHVVMGHFWPKDPAQIPKRGKRRWVMPYWRGPEGHEAWAHVYNVSIAEASDARDTEK